MEPEADSSGRRAWAAGRKHFHRKGRSAGYKMPAGYGYGQLIGGPGYRALTENFRWNGIFSGSPIHNQSLVGSNDSDTKTASVCSEDSSDSSSVSSATTSATSDAYYDSASESGSSNSTTSNSIQGQVAKQFYPSLSQVAFNGYIAAQQEKFGRLMPFSPIRRKRTFSNVNSSENSDSFTNQRLQTEQRSLSTNPSMITMIPQRPHSTKRKIRYCEVHGCKKYSQGGTSFCVAHGGGRRCKHPGCTTGARGSTDCCIKHGGGKRCQAETCKSSAIGSTAFCIKHGGGRRCQVEDCEKAAQGATKLCVRHGGGRKCSLLNCQSIAKSRSRFCAKHTQAVSSGSIVLA